MNVNELKRETYAYIDHKIKLCSMKAYGGVEI
jgi:hypothetical protein